MNLRVTWPTILVSLAAAAGAACGGGSAGPSDDAGQCMPVTPPPTCPSPPPSYQNEIRFVVAGHCAQSLCHADGGAEAAKDFTTYQGLAADHLTVAFVVAQCPSSPMPPPGYPQLTTAQRLALATW